MTYPIASDSTGDGGVGAPGARQSSSVVIGGTPLIDSNTFPHSPCGWGVRALYRVVVDEQVHEGMSRILLTC